MQEEIRGFGPPHKSRPEAYGPLRRCGASVAVVASIDLRAPVWVQVIRHSPTNSLRHAGEIQSCGITGIACRLRNRATRMQVLIASEQIPLWGRGLVLRESNTGNQNNYDHRRRAGRETANASHPAHCHKSSKYNCSQGSPWSYTSWDTGQIGGRQTLGTKNSILSTPESKG